MKFNLVLCHGKSERCFSYSGHQFPLCSRCTGIFFGFVSALLIEYSAGLPSAELFPLYIALGLPAAVDGTTQLISDRESNNLTRLLTGFAGGLGLMLLIRTAKMFLGI